MADESYGWDIDVQLLAEAVNSLRLLVWAKTKDSEKGRNRPEPIRPPGYRPTTEESFGGSHMTVDETKAWLGW